MLKPISHCHEFANALPDCSITLDIRLSVTDDVWATMQACAELIKSEALAPSHLKYVAQNIHLRLLCVDHEQVARLHAAFHRTQPGRITGWTVTLGKTKHMGENA